jgi:hypothetical protein
MRGFLQAPAGPQTGAISPQWSGEQQAGGYCNSFICKAGSIIVDA